MVCSRVTFTFNFTLKLEATRCCETFVCLCKITRCYTTADCNLYSSPYIVRVIKSRRMRWAEHVAHMVEERGVYRVLVGKETTGET